MYKLIFPKGAKPHTKSVEGGCVPAAPPPGSANAEGDQGSFIGGVSTAPSLAIGYTYTRDARYLYEGHVLLTIACSSGNA